MSVRIVWRRRRRKFVDGELPCVTPTFDTAQAAHVAMDERVAGDPRRLLEQPVVYRCVYGHFHVRVRFDPRGR